MTIAYKTAGFGTATAVTRPIFSAPIPQVNTDYILQQDFMQNASSYTPLALNTPHPDYPDFVLVHEPDKADVGGLVFRWTRTYAKVPDTYTEPGGTYNYVFIGFLGTLQVAGNIVPPYSGRLRFQRNVQCQIQHQFFLVGPAPLTYSSWEAIPVNIEQRYIWSDGTTEYEIDAINDAVAPQYGASNPSRAQYNTMMATDAANPTSYSIIAESALTHWMGNIYRLTTKRVKAQ